MNDEQRQIFALLLQAAHQIPLADEERRMKLLRLVRVCADEVLLREGSSPEGGDPLAGLHAQHAEPGPVGDTPRHVQCWDCECWVDWLEPDGCCSCCTRIARIGGEP